jgi:hypothetical protein
MDYYIGLPFAVVAIAASAGIGCIVHLRGKKIAQQAADIDVLEVAREELLLRLATKSLEARTQKAAFGSLILWITDRYGKPEGWGERVPFPDLFVAAAAVHCGSPVEEATLKLFENFQEENA